MSKPRKSRAMKFATPPSRATCTPEEWFHFYGSAERAMDAAAASGDVAFVERLAAYIRGDAA